MEFILGFLIACAVGLTGVGAGSITAPVLILFFHLKPAIAVGTALTFSSAIKFAVLPLYLKRKQVDYRILKLLCMGGIPGVLIGVRLLSQLDTKSHESGIFLLLGTTIVIVFDWAVCIGRSAIVWQLPTPITRDGCLPSPR